MKLHHPRFTALHLFRKACGISLLGLMFIMPAQSAWTAEIHAAAESGKLDKVKKLLSDNPELFEAREANGETPLPRAVRGNRKEVVMPTP